MIDFQKLLNSFNYHFSEKLIAQMPAKPRDAARLLVYERNSNSIKHDTFKNLANYLPKNAVLVLNKTKVVPARLEVSKPTGGKARILYIDHTAQTVRVISDRKLEVGSAVTLNSTISFLVESQDNQFYILKPSFKILELYKVLDKYGQTPLPPYIKRSPLKGKKLLSEYNTVFAKRSGSVAAPTASLHFTKSLLNKIKSSGVKIHYVTLHVNLGTFASLTEEQVQTGRLHSEYFEIDKKTASALNKAKRSGQPIIAVGTTVVRTLESAADIKGELNKLSGYTDLFISEDYKLKFVDELITNFHVPKSSLLMLVSAFTGRGPLMHIYQKAVQKKYRLFSFGDGMYIK